MTDTNLELAVGSVLSQRYLLHYVDDLPYMSVHGFDGNVIMLITVAKLVKPEETKARVIPETVKTTIANFYQGGGVRAPIIFNDELSYFMTDKFMGITS